MAKKGARRIQVVEEEPEVINGREVIPDTFDPSRYSSKADRIRAFNQYFPGQKQSQIAKALSELTGEPYAQSQVANALSGGKGGKAPRKAPGASRAAVSNGLDLEAIRMAQALIKRLGASQAKELVEALS